MLVLLTYLTALQMTAAIIHNFTCLIVLVKLKAFRAGTDDSSSRNNGTLVATASVVQGTLIYKQRSRSEIRQLFSSGKC